MLYKVLREGIKQRSNKVVPKVGDIIQVSDTAAPELIAEGWIIPHTKKSWFGNDVDTREEEKA